MSIRDSIKTLSPTWLQDDSANGVGGKYVYSIGLAFDGLLEKLNQAIHAWMPPLADPSALPYIGVDRLIIRGLTQTDRGYASSLQRAFDDWQTAGTSWSVLRRALSYVFSPDQPSPFAYEIRVEYRAYPVEFTRNVDQKYFDVNTSKISSAYNFPSYDTDKPPYASSGAYFDWDSLSQGNIGYQFNDVDYINYWRWFLAVSGCFDQFGLHITSMSDVTPIEVTTALPHGLTTGDTVSIDGVNSFAALVTAVTNNSGNIQITTNVAHSFTTGDKIAIVDLSGSLPANTANGRWTVTVVDATNAILDGSVFAGSAPGGAVSRIFTDSSWTVTVTAPDAFELDGSVASGGFTNVHPSGRVFRKASNSWVDKAPFVFGTTGVKIGRRPDASIGLNLPPNAIRTLRPIMSMWKSAHTNCHWMIISLSPSLFLGSAGFSPDGRFGRWSRIMNNQYVPSRFPNARYCSGAE